MSKILVIEKGESFQKAICNTLSKAGYKVMEAKTGQEALPKIQNNLFDAIVVDIGLPDTGETKLINTAWEINKNTVIIIVTAHNTLELAVNAMEGGAYYFLQKPFSTKELEIKIKKALQQRGLANEVNYLRHERKLIYKFDNIIGESLKIKQIFSLLNKVSNSSSTILITGETGTGKELVAGAIHYNSPRAPESFVKVNCAALPDSLLESELFGHEKGAFTGATQQRIGRCEQANEGTLFLDEVSEMSPLTQGKILRFLQEKQFERLGSTVTVQVDVRVIGATNKDLSQEIKQGRFRKDLFFRLNVVNVEMPPLRERKEDIPLLAEYFLHKYGHEIGRNNLYFSDDTINMMLEYNWPGNVRELENTIERAALLSEGSQITGEDIWMGGNKLAVSQKIKLPPGGISLWEAEKSLIFQALERTNWVQKNAAQLLKVSQRVINYKIRKYGIKIPKRGLGEFQK